MRRLFLIVFALGLCLQYSLAQVKPIYDVAQWTHLSLDYKLTKKWDIHLKLQNRINENLSAHRSWFADIGISHDLGRYVSLSADYVFTQRRRKDDAYQTIHQAYLAGFLKYKFNRISLRSRSMIQLQVKDISWDEQSRVPEYVFRQKLSASYQLTRRVAPYAAFEATSGIFEVADIQDYGLQRTRWFAGCEWKLARKTELDTYCMYQQSTNYSSNYFGLFVLGLGIDKKF